MKKHICRLLLAALAVLCCGCAEALPDSPIIIDSQAGTPSASPDSTSTDNGQSIVTEDDTLPPHSGMVRSYLTNEWIEPEVAEKRPVAVMIPNEASAIPHYNLSEASVLYEANVEGRMTRMMAIFEDWESLNKIGNVRSLRNYYAYWAFEWDAYIVHIGGPLFINDLIDEETTDSIDENDWEGNLAFFRTGDRSTPHNAYVSGSGLAKAINKYGYSQTDRGLRDSYHYNFAGKAVPNTLQQYGENAMDAVYIDMSGCYPLTRCYFEYNEEDGLYYRSQHLVGGTDGPHTDGATGKQLSFKNILVQNVSYEEIGEGYLAFQVHDNTMDGWYFTNGKGIHVNWEKSSDYGATRYYDDAGNEIVMNTGKTMVCIVEKGDNFTFR